MRGKATRLKFGSPTISQRGETTGLQRNTHSGTSTGLIRHAAAVSEPTATDRMFNYSSKIMYIVTLIGPRMSQTFGGMTRSMY